MNKILETDLTLFDDQLFFFFRNKYKPEILSYLKEKHYFETENKIPFSVKQINLFIWNGILVKEIVQLGFTYEHLANHYNNMYQKILKTTDIHQLHQVENYMFAKYIDIIINQQESTDHLLVNKILHYLHMHIEDTLSLVKLTNELNISQSHASKIFKEHMNTTIIKYSKYLKIERAKSLLKSNATVTEIGELLGFYDQAHFSRTFKKFVGQSPQAFKLKKKPEGF